MHSFIAVIAPAAAILLANIAVLSIVMYKLHQGIQERSQDLCKSYAKKNSVIKIDKMSDILVTDSRIALLAVEEVTLVFQWLLCIFNSL